jgi:hypothetical protein
MSEALGGGLYCTPGRFRTPTAPRSYSPPGKVRVRAQGILLLFGKLRGLPAWWNIPCPFFVRPRSLLTEALTRISLIWGMCSHRSGPTMPPRKPPPREVGRAPGPNRIGDARGRHPAAPSRPTGRSRRTNARAGEEGRLGDRVHRTIRGVSRRRGWRSGGGGVTDDAALGTCRGASLYSWLESYMGWLKGREGRTQYHALLEEELASLRG